MLSTKFSVYFALFIIFAAFHEPALAVRKSYVVYLGSHSHGPDVTASDLSRVVDSHTGLLASFLGSHEKARDAMITSYKRYINGFAAVMEEEEAAAIAEHPDVISVFPDGTKKLHTTYSWDSLLLETNGSVKGSVRPLSAWTKARFGEDSIIANLDTGVWPESQSFSGDGYGPIPSKWKGTCQFDKKNGKSLCNRKLVGARYFNKGFATYVREVLRVELNASYYNPRDIEGHGSHTLSTAAGNFVSGASVFGIGNGTAKGGSPRARVATYRVCFPPMVGAECLDSDIMEGFDAAIDDGVDVISMSLGGYPMDYFLDGIAIGSFHAVQNGRVVVASAGNSGPTSRTVTNIAPWIITVGASSLDRSFQSNVIFENGLTIQGASMSPPLPQDKLYQFITGAQAAAANSSEDDSLLCLDNTLDPEKVKGKVVVCLRGISGRLAKGQEALRAGAAGLVVCNSEYDADEAVPDLQLLPATNVIYQDGQTLLNYLNTTRNPIPKGTLSPPAAVLGAKPAPYVAGFSSRGPNRITPEILKPDVTAPGIDIIAAYTQAESPTGAPFDHRRTPFVTMSGTSMACPHVAGLAGLLKTLYPDWTPGAIRSAIMTTARTRDNTGHPMKDENSEATPLVYGAGNIRPNRAVDPGLVYDVTTEDYLDLLCGLGYNHTMIEKFSGTNYKCPESYNILNFNNPAITVPNLYGSDSLTVTRTLKNVGTPGTYTARIQAPPGFAVAVEPTVLKFDKIGEEKSFKVTVKAITSRAKSYAGGHLTWTDGSHYVRTTLVLALAI